MYQSTKFETSVRLYHFLRILCLYIYYYFSMALHLLLRNMVLIISKLFKCFPSCCVTLACEIWGSIGICPLKGCRDSWGKVNNKVTWREAEQSFFFVGFTIYPSSVCSYKFICSVIKLSSPTFQTRIIFMVTIYNCVSKLTFSFSFPPLFCGWRMFSKLW